MRWFDVVLPAGWHEAQEAAAGVLEALAAEVREFGGVGVSAAMLAGLVRGRLEQSDEAVDVRGIDAFAVEAWADDKADPGGSAGLVFQPVALLSGPGWLLSCWRERSIHRGAETVGRAPASSHEDLRAAVARAWENGPGRTAGDLGVLVMDQLALTYGPAHRTLYAWLEDWELALYLPASEGDGPVDRETLPELWGAMALLRRHLGRLNLPGKRRDITRAWFADCTDQKAVNNVDDRINRALSRLRELGDTLRASFAVLQARLAEADRERGERLERTVEFVAAAFLLPTLVVGFFGANTKIPGAGTWWGFWVMIGAMLALGVGTFVTLRHLHARRARMSTPSRAALKRAGLRQLDAPVDDARRR